MPNFAVIKNGVVQNCIISESKEVAESATQLTCIEYFLVEPGWSYIDSQFNPPAGE
jgi:hypothetical protein